MKLAHLIKRKDYLEMTNIYDVRNWMWQHFFRVLHFHLNEVNRGIAILHMQCCYVWISCSLLFRKYLYTMKFFVFSFFFLFLLHYWSSSLRMFSSFPYYTKSDVILDYYIRVYLHVHARNFVLFMTEYMWIGFVQLLYCWLQLYHFFISDSYFHLSATKIIENAIQPHLEGP